MVWGPCCLGSGGPRGLVGGLPPPAPLLAARRRERLIPARPAPWGLSIDGGHWISPIDTGSTLCELEPYVLFAGLRLVVSVGIMGAEITRPGALRVRRACLSAVPAEGELLYLG